MRNDLRLLKLALGTHGVNSIHDGLNRGDMELEIMVFLYAYAEQYNHASITLLYFVHVVTFPPSSSVYAIERSGIVET